MDFSVIVINVVLGIPVYFLWRWILKRFIENSPKRKFTTWVATIISTPLIYAAIIMLSAVVGVPHQRPRAGIVYLWHIPSPPGLRSSQLP